MCGTGSASEFKRSFVAAEAPLPHRVVANIDGPSRRLEISIGGGACSGSVLSAVVSSTGSGDGAFFREGYLLSKDFRSGRESFLVFV